MEGKLGGIVVALLIVGGIFWFKFNNKDSAGQEVHHAAILLFETLPDYNDHADDYEAYLDNHHESLFDRHYRMGSRRTSSSFNEDAYWNDLFTAMVIDARSDGNEELANNLAGLHQRLMRGG